MISLQTSEKMGAMIFIYIKFISSEFFKGYYWSNLTSACTDVAISF